MPVKYYSPDHNFPCFRSQFQTIITVTDEDSLGAAAGLKNVAVLNFASRRRPGGGYRAVIDVPMPIKTQEEDLFRRSNLPELMDTEAVRCHYPLDGITGLYTDEVFVTKDQKLQEIAEPFTFALVTVAAVVNPSDGDADLVDGKVRLILNIAADNAHQNLVLGAWGCGVFNNDPHQIAGLFRKHLSHSFSGVFENVVFAVPGKSSVNHQVFESVMGVLS